MHKGIRCLIFLLPIISQVPAGEESQTPDQVLEVAGKALPWVQEEGQWWIEKKKCVSCHHTSFGIWVGNLAKENGLPFPDTLLTEWRDWAWKHQLSPREKKEPTEADEQIGDRNIEGLSQLLLNGSEPLSKEAAEQFRKKISAQQKKAGHWSPYGQLPRQVRPIEETTAVSTMWAALALQEGEAEEKAQGWLKKNDASGFQAKTTEWFALEALRKRDDESLEILVKRQNEDGGWSWLAGEESSDPMATGQALLAIGRLGKQADYPAEISRAVQFLKKTQNEEGYWKTFSTKDREEETRISNFWGTTWAVIGLLESKQK